MEHRNVRFPGVPLALGAAVLFGASTPFSKLLLGSVSPWLLAGILYLGAGIGLLVVLLFRAASLDAPPESPLRLRDLPWLAAVVAAGGNGAGVRLLAHAFKVNTITLKLAIRFVRIFLNFMLVQ